VWVLNGSGHVSLVVNLSSIAVFEVFVNDISFGFCFSEVYFDFHSSFFVSRVFMIRNSMKAHFQSLIIKS
jgi:hypothetical protein